MLDHLQKSHVDRRGSGFVVDKFIRLGRGVGTACQRAQARQVAEIEKRIAACAYLELADGACPGPVQDCGHGGVA